MNVIYYKTSSGREPAREYVNGLPSGDRVIITADLESIRDHGIKNTNVITRKLMGDLWEIKTGLYLQQRLFYCIIDNTLIILHACKKQKEGAQHNDVTLAIKRMKNLL